jgi:hypothetical protein
MHVSIKPDAKDLLKVAIFHPVAFRGTTFFYATKAVIQNVKHNTGRSFFTQFFLCEFALMQLKNLHHFSNLHTNVRFIAIWHRQYMLTFG